MTTTSCPNSDQPQRGSVIDEKYMTIPDEGIEERSLIQAPPEQPEMFVERASINSTETFSNEAVKQYELCAMKSYRRMSLALPLPKPRRRSQHRSRSIDFVPRNHKQHNRSGSTRRVSSTHPLERVKNSGSIYSLDATMGVTLNLKQQQKTIEKCRSGFPSNAGAEDFRPSLVKKASMGEVMQCYPPLRDYPVLDVHASRRVSTGSCVSELSNYHNVYPMALGSNYRDRKSMVCPEAVDEDSPNRPSAALEYPPLHFLLKRTPCLAKMISEFVRWRWVIGYPLHARIPFSRSLRKMNIFCTCGEFLLLLPFFAAVTACTIFTFLTPDVSISGHAARVPLIFAFITAMRNSVLTLILGIPFERAIWYHKLAARLAYTNSIMHCYAAFFYPDHIDETVLPPPYTYPATNPNFVKFLFSDTMNASGSMMVLLITGMIITALPPVRRKLFELFQFVHILFAALIILCAFFHTGYLIPLLGAVTWGLDLLIRKVVMPLRYPRKAGIRIISDSVVELCFPKTSGFDYNPGQYVYLAVPEIGIFQWHPFSLSSSPEQKIVTLHIRKAGSWTSKLHELAEHQSEIDILLEGPYGTVGVDIFSDRYKMIMLFSGGIGVTPCQAICNQLMYEQSQYLRDLKKLSFIWIERDPHVMQNVDVVRRKSCRNISDTGDIEEGYSRAEQQQDFNPQGIASTLLALVPASRLTDEQLEHEYPSSDFVDLDDIPPGEDDHMSILTALSRRLLQEKKRDQRETANAVIQRSDTMYSSDDDTIDQSFLDAAYDITDEGTNSPQNALDLQVYLTGKKDLPTPEQDLPFVHFGRPDIKQLFLNMKEEAIASGEQRVAVCVCAPKRLVTICQKACAKYSDSQVCFDFHSEVFG